MSKKEPENDRPKIYVTARGERYVEAKDVLTSKRGREVVEKMAKFAYKQSADRKSSSQ